MVNTYRVLVVHSEERVGKNIQRILSNFNLEFIYAQDGLDALAAAKYEGIDLIIADVNLDIINGIEMMRMINNDRNTRDIDVIFLNDKLDFDLIRLARGLNAKGFLMTPYLDNTLIYTVQKALPVAVVGSNPSDLENNYFTVRESYSRQA